MTIHHHGAVDGVTGSCHELVLGPDASLLIDCGLFQGEDAAPQGGPDQLAIGFDVRHIKALVVTHVHIDHVGRIPWLLAAGFEGPVAAFLGVVVGWRALVVMIALFRNRKPRASTTATPT